MVDSPVLVTGATGFTGRYVLAELVARRVNYVCLQSRLHDTLGVIRELRESGATRVLHLAGVAVTHNVPPMVAYQANVMGATSLLTALAHFRRQIDTVVMASTASIYSPSAGESVVDETTSVRATNHYGASKLAMETIADQFRHDFPLIMVRPFNYTGVGQSTSFLIPKIVSAFQARQRELVIGNRFITREFNDVRHVACVYADLLEECRPVVGPVNLCTGRGVSISEVLRLCSELTEHTIQAKTDTALIRVGEPPELVGNPSRINSIVRSRNMHDFRDTLAWMLSGSPTEK